jgi:6-pyruvoyltetrahydropterin/6-carboxytetrahydropterin synthase
MSGLVRMTRRVTFSSGHRYWFDHLSEHDNRALFGPWASRFNHGHNYVLDVEVEGIPNPANGMVVNIKRIDEILREKIVSALDQRSINDEVSEFTEIAPTLENLLLYIRDRLTSAGVLPPECRLTGIRLEEMPGFYGELDQNMKLTRTYEFAASHRLDAPHLSRETNLDLYGKCNNPAGHGHNYILEVTVEGSPDPQSGMICDLGAIDEVVNREVVDRYDHKHLNEDLPEFAGIIPSSEIVVQEIYQRLNGKLPAKLERVRLWETARNMFEVSHS